MPSAMPPRASIRRSSSRSTSRPATSASSGIALGSKLPQPPRSDDRVLVLAENVLQLLRPLHQLPPASRARPRTWRAYPSFGPRAARRSAGSSCSSRTALRNLPSPVDKLVERDRGPARLEGSSIVRPCRRGAPGTHPNAGLRASGCGSGSARSQHAASSGPARLASSPPSSAASPLRRAEEDVEVTHLAEHAAQLLQPLVELGGVGRDELVPRTEQSAQATDADAHVVETLGIAAEACARVMALDLAQLLAQAAPELLERTGEPARRGQAAERAEQLRQPVSLFCAGRDELVRDLVETVGAAVSKLDLHLDELVALLRGVEHRDLVRGHLGSRAVARHELAAPVRSQLRYALERPAAQMGVQEGEQLLGRLAPALLQPRARDANRRQEA